jgi:hypothetical protein
MLTRFSACPEATTSPPVPPLGGLFVLTCTFPPGVLGPVVAATVERVTGVFGDLRQRNPDEVVIEIGGGPVVFDAIFHRAADAYC